MKSYNQVPCPIENKHNGLVQIEFLNKLISAKNTYGATSLIITLCDKNARHAMNIKTLCNARVGMSRQMQVCEMA